MWDRSVGFQSKKRNKNKKGRRNEFRDLFDK